MGNLSRVRHQDARETTLATPGWRQGMSYMTTRSPLGTKQPAGGKTQESRFETNIRVISHPPEEVYLNRSPMYLHVRE